MKQSLDFKQTFNFKELLEKAMSLPARQILDRDIRFYAAVALIFRENSQSKATELGMILLMKSEAKNLASPCPYQ